MRLLDIFRSTAQDRRDQEDLQSLRRRLVEGGGKRETVLRRVPIPSLSGAIVDFEGIFDPMPIPPAPTVTQTVLLTKLYSQLLTLREGGGLEAALRELLEPLAACLPDQTQEREDFGLSVSVLDRLPNPSAVVEGIVRTALSTPFPRLQEVVRENVLIASKIDPANLTRKPLIMPTEAKDQQPSELVKNYLSGTPFASFLQTPLPFAVPFKARFEHTHIVGGSGHGKTQLLQSLILRDLEKLREGKGSIVVIDSQSDMIRTILHLSEMGELSDRLVLIDPNDIECPPCLNLFDFGLDRLSGYSPVEREKLINGAVALYEYLFGALLGAELSMRQGVIFRYLARLMMTVPGATIHTLMQFMENPQEAAGHFEKLDRVSRHFFESQFFTPSFGDTRKQVLARLWGVISNSVLERMFANERNKVNLFAATNRGSIILINTAKDLLKQEGCEILGRFFIALLCQAAQERASIPEDKRKSTFVYIDEAHDYFDESLENLFNQARKYKVGLIIAHQNLEQFDLHLRATVMASTSIKMVGGLSAGDANAFAKEMRCDREYLQGMRKRGNGTEFACFIRNFTEHPVRLTVPFGQMESRPKLTDEEYTDLIGQNRARYGASDTLQATQVDRQTTQTDLDLDAADDPL